MNFLMIIKTISIFWSLIFPHPVLMVLKFWKVMCVPGPYKCVPYKMILRVKDSCWQVAKKRETNLTIVSSGSPDNGLCQLGSF